MNKQLLLSTLLCASFGLISADNGATEAAESVEKTRPSYKTQAFEAARNKINRFNTALASARKSAQHKYDRAKQTLSTARTNSYNKVPSRPQAPSLSKLLPSKKQGFAIFGAFSIASLSYGLYSHWPTHSSNEESK